MGVFEFNRTPFGFYNSPISFIRIVNYVFSEIMNQGIVIAYVDDLVIPSADEIEGLERLKIVLKVAAENGLKIKWTKCQFLQRQIEYVGYIIRDGKIKPSPNKVTAISRTENDTILLDFDFSR